MRRFAVIAAGLVAASCSSTGTTSQPSPQASPSAPAPTPTPTSAPTSTAGQPSAAAAPADTNPERNPLVQQLLRNMAGHEQEPASQVFKNVQVLKTLPAADFARTMGRFALALGQRCSYCHVQGDFPKDDKANKQIARQMLDMTAAINTKLQTIQGLPDADARVSCNTCHRGSAKPAG